MTHSNLPNSTDLDTCLLADRPGLRRRLRGLRQRQDRGQPSDEGLAQLWREIEASQAVLERRRALVPEIQFPPELPVSERREEVAAENWRQKNENLYRN